MKIKTLFLFIALLLLSGCGFHLRQAANFPSELHVLYFKPYRPYSSFTTLLRDQLESMNVRLVKSASEAPYSLIIVNDRFYHENPPIVSTTWAQVNYKFVEVVRVAIKDNKGHAITTGSFSASRAIVLNANQIYTTNLDTLTKQQLQRDITSLIYNWLTSTNVRKILRNPKSKKNANSVTPTSKHI